MERVDHREAVAQAQRSRVGVAEHLDHHGDFHGARRMEPMPGVHEQRVGAIEPPVVNPDSLGGRPSDARNDLLPQPGAALSREHQGPRRQEERRPQSTFNPMTVRAVPAQKRNIHLTSSALRSANRTSSSAKRRSSRSSNSANRSPTRASKRAKLRSFSSRSSSR